MQRDLLTTVTLAQPPLMRHQYFYGILVALASG